METRELKGNGRIVVAKTEIFAPHMNEVLAFGFPMAGPGTYKNVMAKVSEEGLRPTSAQTLSLVNLALQNPNDDFCKDLLAKFHNQYFWSATENLWGKEDVIVYDNVDGKMPSDRVALLKRMKDGDKAVRVVPYGFETGSQSVENFAKNPYVVAQVGDKDFAGDIVAKVAQGVSSRQPYVYALGPQSSDTKRFSALYSYWNDDRLDLNGDFDDGNYTGYASPVRIASAESAKPQKK